MYATPLSNNHIVLIPLGGVGERFAEVGHSTPKPLVNALGQPVLYWLLQCLNLIQVRYVLIPFHPDLALHRFEDRLRKDFPNIPFFFVRLPGNTRGAADTIRIALESLNEDDGALEDSPIISLDGDNFYIGQDILTMWGGRDCLVTFEDYGNQPIYSYIRVDDGRVVEIKEKVMISNLACTGAYGFSSWRKLLKFAAKAVADEALMVKNEFYLSSVIALMLKEEEGSIRFEPMVVPRDSYICLGTPLQLRAFCNDVPLRDARSGEIIIKPRRFCFDLDNTLVTHPRTSGDYATVEPIVHMVEYLKYLKKFDHTIIIYTDRGMQTHGGNASAAIADIGRVTLETLDKFGIPYDEICFGKPSADYYIDDLAVSAHSDIEKALGFYQSEVKPRVFNDLSRPASLQLIRKASKTASLEGEIYYYNHIPVSVKDCFPIMIAFDGEEFSWYDVERINGTTASNLLLSEELTPAALASVMGTLNRIHIATSHETADVNIYANYADKIKSRYETYAGYAKFPDSDKVYDSLVEQLGEYEADGRGRCVPIHGDPVMSNVLINSFGKIKLVDMRGKLGGTLSLRGDEIYDWAKLYQSLIGYDEIMQGRPVSESYRQTMLRTFWDTLQTLSPDIREDDIKLVTRSLLFSLLPLHTRESESEKQQGYYRLIDKCS